MQMMERRSSYYGESYQQVAEAEVAKYQARGWRAVAISPERPAAGVYAEMVERVANGASISPQVVERYRRKAEQEEAA
jgi:hypothetical protein